MRFLEATRVAVAAEDNCLGSHSGALLPVWHSGASGDSQGMLSESNERLAEEPRRIGIVKIVKPRLVSKECETRIVRSYG